MSMQMLWKTTILNAKHSTLFLSKQSLVNTLAQGPHKFRAVSMLSGDTVLKVEAYWERRAFYWWRFIVPCPT